MTIAGRLTDDDWLGLWRDRREQLIAFAIQWTDCRNGAEDAYQEAGKCLFSLPAERRSEIEKPLAYLWKIVENRAKSWRRRQRARRLIPIEPEKIAVMQEQHPAKPTISDGGNGITRDLITGAFLFISKTQRIIFRAYLTAENETLYKDLPETRRNMSIVTAAMELVNSDNRNSYQASLSRARKHYCICLSVLAKAVSEDSALPPFVNAYFRKKLSEKPALVFEIINHIIRTHPELKDQIPRSLRNPDLSILKAIIDQRS